LLFFKIENPFSILGICLIVFLWETNPFFWALGFGLWALGFGLWADSSKPKAQS
jgi:hypothetical protein